MARWNTRGGHEHPHVHLHPSTPVLVGAGQVAERVGDAGYSARSPAALAGAAAAFALDDAAGGRQSRTARIRERIDVVGVVRQFEDSGLAEPTPLGRPDNVPRAVARRVGVEPQRAILAAGGGQSPHALVLEFCARIAAGEADVVLLAGAEALSSVRYWQNRGSDDGTHNSHNSQDSQDSHDSGGSGPDWSEEVGGELEDRGQGLADMTSPRLSALGLDHAPAAYALFENARRARLRLDRESYARSMGELFARFTDVAARNPLAAARDRRTAEELVRVTDRNRVIAEPYPRFLVARDQVNQGAAVLLTSLRRARQLGVDPHRYLFCHGHATVAERPLLERADLSTSAAAHLAVETTLAEAEMRAADLDLLDIYSCFPVAVSVVIEALGLDPDDPRGFTVTGGLPFFGGPGNDYAMHSLAEMATLLRARPGTRGLVTANGGVLSSQSMGIWSTEGVRWRAGRDDDLRRRIAALPAPAITDGPRGPARVETYTVVHDRDGRRRGIVVGRLERTDERFLAATADEPATWALLDSDRPVGAPIIVDDSGTARA